MDEIFSDFGTNVNMLKGSYKKLKAYYYYNKNFILMREKIANFEQNEDKMMQTFNKLAECLAHHRKKTNKEYLDNLIKRIDFYVLPKKFDFSNKDKKTIVTNITRNKNLKTVNFFIDMPIELHILDTLWTLFLGKISYEEGLLLYNVYGNTLVDNVIYDKTNLFTINFENNRLFNMYFYKYSDWRNNAFKSLEQNYEAQKDSVMISLDIKSFFYSASCNFSKIEKIFNNNNTVRDLKPLNDIFNSVYQTYYNIIKNFRNDLREFENNEFPLPIGLFSSMILANLYLKDFDSVITKNAYITYYGRYVDDILLVFNKTIDDTNDSNKIIRELLVENNYLQEKEDGYLFVGYNNLKIQNDKIKVIYVACNESRAIIDTYNDTIKIIPSQMNIIPDDELDLLNFDENIYSIEHFNKNDKLRDIGSIKIDTYRVSRYFSSLLYKFKNINIASSLKEIEEQIPKMEKFFTGNRSLEFYTVWLNYMYFLVLTGNKKSLAEFYKKIKKQIDGLTHNFIDRNYVKRLTSINKRVKDALKKHLDICLYTVLALNLELTNKERAKERAKLYINSNMFNHNLVTLPLSNYLEYDGYVPYINMSTDDLGIIPNKFEDSFKVVWSPRFIHYEEILLLLFYYFHEKNKLNDKFNYYKDAFVEKFKKINGIKYDPFNISTEENMAFDNEYELLTINVPDGFCLEPQKIDICVGSIPMEEKQCSEVLENPFKHLTTNNLKVMRSILKDAWIYCENRVKILVLPELYCPIYWLDELIRFSKKSQIAIITGLQYIKAEDGRVFNYLCTILPFKTGFNAKYKNAFLYIREKNDYSPREISGLKKKKLYCKNADKASYQVFKWNGIDIGNMLCYEFTDVVSRALYKGKCDIIAAPVFNSDTTYFSNIIDATVRDLHAFIVQANTSIYGDSRVTGPYSRDDKDIFKIKGGKNDYAIIGTINFKEYADYQLNYYEKEYIKNENSKNKPRNKNSIKKPSARFKNKRTRRKT